MVELHDVQLRRFVATWEKAKAANLELPSSGDPSYASLDALLRHVLAAAKGYMVWTCKALELPDPGIDSVPKVESLAAETRKLQEELDARRREATRREERCEDNLALLKDAYFENNLRFD